MDGMSDLLEIRRAETADIPLIRRLAEEIFPYTYREMHTAAQNDYMMEWMYSPESLRRQMEEGHTFFIAEEKGVPVGYLSIQPEAEDVFHLQKIYLRTVCQGKGYGKTLFRFALEHIRSVHPAPFTLRLNVNRRNTKAVNFYQRMGMHKAEEGDFHIGNGFYMTDYIMEMAVD